MTFKTIIFDFDGTIADTQRYLVDIANRLADEFHFKKIDSADIDKLRKMTAFQACRHLNIKPLSIPFIYKRAKEEYYKTLHEIRPFEGVREIIMEIKKLGHKIGILSSNSVKNVQSFLTLHRYDFFDFVHSTSKIFGKNISLKKLLKKNANEHVIYIGDETRDIEAAKKAGIKAAAVTWGYNSPSILESFKPDFMIKQPLELMALCNI